MLAKILFLITTMGTGGADRQVVELSSRLKNRGHEILVLSIRPPGPMAKDLIAHRVNFLSIAIDKVTLFQGGKALRDTINIVRKFQPHIIHSHMIHANILARLTRLFVHVPVLICTAHSIDERGHKGSGRMRTLLYRLTDPLCDLTTQVSHAGLERYIRIGAVPKHKIRYVPNGVDTRRFAPDPETRARTRRELGFDKEFVWLAVGRFVPQKDYTTMLYAFASAKTKYPDTYLLIAGDGPLRLSMETLAQELGIKERVRFLGVRHDIPELMNAADGYLLSSFWEGMPMVLLEAHAVGLPIVATDVGGNREVVLDGKTGFLVPPKNPETLAQAMLRLIGLPEEERQRMGREGRKHVEENFSIERVVDVWEVLYRELLAKKGVKVE